MTDRYRGYPIGGRSATFNPARVSLASNLSNYNTNPGPGPGPSSAAYLVADADFVSSPARYTTAIPRGFHQAPPSSASPTAPTTRNYKQTSEPRPPSRPGNREPSRTRRSTVDNTARPPIIVTTLQDHHPHNPASHSSAAASHSANPSTNSASPVREPYRASDGKLFTQPASTIRSRSTSRPYHASSSSEEYNRPRDRELVPVSRDVDNYRTSRPSVLYPSDPRHSNAAIDYGDDGYQYTNAGELVKYDLDHAATPAASRSRRHERHESFDRGYHRPNINYNADQRSFNVNTSHDLNRHYSVSSRPYDTRGGPPPSTRGFDKINRAYDSVPPAVPAAPSPGPGGMLDGSTGPLVRREARRPRPVSLTQEIGSRITQPENYYRGHVPDDTYEHQRFYDDSVAARGFGIRLNHQDEPEERSSRYWESKRDESHDDLDRETQRRDKPGPNGSKDSDDEAGHTSDPEQEERHRAYRDESRDRKEARRPSESELERRPSFSFRDKISSGLGMAASAVGFGSAPKRDEKKTTPEGIEHTRRQSLDEPADQPNEADTHSRPSVQDESEKQPERNGDMERKLEADLKERLRREAEAKLNGEAVVSGSDSDEGRRTPSVRRRSSSVSKSYSAGDSQQLKEHVAAIELDEKEVEEKKVERDRSHSPERAHSASPARDDKEGAAGETPPNEESRGRDLVVLSDVKQVRVVSPPREKKEGKPLKGILKQPKASFPEDRNPIREGVAPHKDDKKLKEVPPGAKWTKINRKIVNPEALEIGKERFEVRDDFVIVLRVLSKEDIQAYASATQVLRERRRNKENGDRERERERERDRDRDNDRSYDEYEEPLEEERGRLIGYHHHRHRGDEVALRDDWNEDRERERRRRGRKDEEEYSSRTRDPEHRHHRSHRERT